MKKLLPLLVFGLILLFAYLVGAFVTTEWNTLHWEGSLRGFMAYIGVITASIGALVTHINFDQL